MEVHLPEQKLQKIRAEARFMTRSTTVSVRTVARLIGKMSAASHAVPPAPLFYRHLQMLVSSTVNSSSQGYGETVRLTQDCLEELEWWNHQLSQWNGKSVLTCGVDLIIEADASLLG